MNLLILTQYFWPENFRINDLVEGLVDRGHQVSVLTGHPNYPEGRFLEGYGAFLPLREKYHGARVLRVPLFPRGSGDRLQLILNYASFAITASMIGPLLISEKIDAIIVYEPSPITVGIPAMVLRLSKRAPVLFWLQDLWPESLSATGAVTSKIVLKLVEIMVRWLYKGCDRILVQSRAFIPSVVKLGGDPNKIYYFPNSAEDHYRPVSVPQDAPERKLMPKGFCVTFAGNIGVAQDFETIIRAAILLKHQPDIQFVIIGDGRMRSQVERSIQQNHLTNNFHILGRHQPERMHFFFSLSDVLLVTLRRDPIFALTIPSKIQSYLACGKPIIAALDGEGALVIRRSGAGLTCPSQDFEKLAETILTMFHLSKSQRTAMGENGRLLFNREFERESLLDSLERWLVDVTMGGTN